jgi:hypothetical protein
MSTAEQGGRTGALRPYFFDPHTPLALALTTRTETGGRIPRDQVAVEGTRAVTAEDINRYRTCWTYLSLSQARTAMHATLHALSDGGLGAMSCGDAAAWACLGRRQDISNEDLPALVARWEQFTNHGWLAAYAGFSIDEVEQAGAAPGDEAVRFLLAMQPGSWRRVLPKIRTRERLGPLTT